MTEKDMRARPLRRPNVFISGFTPWRRRASLRRSRWRRDFEASTRLVWVARDGTVVATLRLLDEGNGVVRIGHRRRVAWRRTRHCDGIELAGDRPVVLAAQTHLTDWYSQFGFVRDGDDYLEDGVVHTPMRLRKVPLA
jgi:ElaA protein